MYVILVCMDTIYFPPQYKKALLNETKNKTIRVGNEIGRYSTGRVYVAKSYAGANWNIKIKIEKAILTTFKSLPKFGISKRSVESLQKKENLLPNSKVEVIKFVVLK